MIDVGTALGEPNPVWEFYSGDISDVNNTSLGLGYQDEIIESADYADAFARQPR